MATGQVTSLSKGWQTTIHTHTQLRAADKPAYLRWKEAVAACWRTWKTPHRKGQSAGLNEAQLLCYGAVWLKTAVSYLLHLVTSWRTQGRSECREAFSNSWHGNQSIPVFSSEKVIRLFLGQPLCLHINQYWLCVSLCLWWYCTSLAKKTNIKTLSLSSSEIINFYTT